MDKLHSPCFLRGGNEGFHEKLIGRKKNQENEMRNERG